MITLIAAVSENNVIGYQGRIPWRIPEDLERFKSLTMGNPIVMGRKTFESLPKRPLPGRKNVVVTNTPQLIESYSDTGTIFAHDVTSALRIAEHYGQNTYVIGGEQIYRATIDFADRLEITRVHSFCEGDAFFPDIEPNFWIESAKDERGAYTFLTYNRI